MWTVRRLIHPLRNRGFNVRTFRSVCAKSELSTFGDDKAVTIACHLPQVIRTENMSLKGFYGWNDCFVGRCMFSSQAGGAIDSGDKEDEDLDDGISELESSTSEEVNKDELVSEPEFSDDDINDAAKEHSNELDLYDENKVRGVEGSIEQISSLAMLKAVMKYPYVSKGMAEWMLNGNKLQRPDINFVMANLRKRRMYEKALEFSSWLEYSKRYFFGERDYARKLDLFCREKAMTSYSDGVEGIEKFFNISIPDSCRGELAYRTLLLHTAIITDVKKSEEVFNRIEDLDFQITSVSCNHLLLHYKRTDMKKMADVLLLMEKHNIKPTLFTYNMLIDAKGQSNDITGMEQIVETMKSKGFQPDFRTISLIAKHYVLRGLKDKAIATLKQLEGNNMKELRKSAWVILPLYAIIGDEESVSRIWKACVKNPIRRESLAAMEAFGRLNKVEEVEEVYRALNRNQEGFWGFVGKETKKQLGALFEVYYEQLKLKTGNDMVNRMVERGFQVNDGITLFACHFFLKRR